MAYFQRLSGLTSVSWARMEAWQWPKLIPADVKATMVELDFHLRKLNVRGVRHMIEFPLCESVPDPLWVVEWTDKTSGERTDFYLKAWD